MPVSPLRFGALFGSVLLVACASAERYPERPSLLDGSSRTPRYRTPATFRYHPSDVGELQMAASLPDGAELLLGERGERWLVAATGQTEVSSMFAPERLVDAANVAEESWLFIGQEGGVYEARTPIGPFVRSGLPPRPLGRVTVSDEALVGVTLAGGVVRSLDFGQTWQDVATTGRAVDVEILPDGRGLLLCIPEELHATSDHGRTFEPLGVPPFGAWGLQQQDDDIVVEGALGPRVFSPDTKALRATNAPPAAKRVARLVPPTGPSASSLQSGQAAITLERYYEISADKEGFQLRQGVIGEGLSTQRLPILDDCQEVRLAARERQLLVVCAPSDESDVELTLFASGDTGENFRRLATPVRGSIDLVQITLLAQDRFAISGICADDTSGAGCRPSGIHTAALALEKEKFVLLQAKTPSLAGPALALTATPDGTRIHALGRRTKGSALGAFVSDDGGVSFRAREVPELEVGPPGSSSGLRVVSARAGTDGGLAAVIHEPISRLQLLVSLDEEGRLVALGSSPRSDATLGAAGSMALAVSHPSGEVLESLDGGTEWRSVGRIPTAGCVDGACAVACFDAGCVIGEAVTRVGWEGQHEAALLSPATPGATGIGKVRSVASTAVCRFNAEWTPFAADAIPSASSAALGESAWFTFHSQFRESSFTFHEMPRAGVLRSEVLIAPSAAPGNTALYYTHQIEGAAVLRQIDGQGVEIAWVNLFESPAARRVKLPPSHRVKTRATRFQTKLAEPSALTIGRSGLFFAGDGDRPYFLTGREVEALNWPAWPTSIAEGRDELIRAGDRKLLLRFFATGSAVAWSPVTQRGDAGAQTVGLPWPGDFGVTQEMTLAYTGDEPGLYVADFGARGSTAYVVPFIGADVPLGEPVPVPTQRHLGPEPAPCSARIEKTTPRAVTSYEPGTRHAVVISDPNEPTPVLVTGDAVLHGTPAEPCAVVFAAATAGASTDAVSALIFVDPGARSWAFRKAPDASREDELEYRAMSCAFDPNAEVPEEVFQAPGTER